MNVPFPLFPARSLLPSFPARSSQWRLWLTRVPSSLSLRIPFPPPSFPLFPAPFPCFRLCSCPFPYWRLCSCPLSLFSIMFLPPFPIVDYVPDNLCFWCPYVTYTDCRNCNYYVLSIWVNRPDNYYLCTKLCSSSHIILMQESPF